MVKAGVLWDPCIQVNMGAGSAQTSTLDQNDKEKAVCLSVILLTCTLDEDRCIYSGHTPSCIQALKPYYFIAMHITHHLSSE